MSLPALYLEGLMQRSLRGRAELDAYKLGLIEAVLKEPLRADGRAGGPGQAVDAAVRTAIEVARWDPPAAAGQRLGG
jgi:hypothetical protein